MVTFKQEMEHNFYFARLLMRMGFLFLNLLVVKKLRNQSIWVATQVTFLN